MMTKTKLTAWAGPLAGVVLFSAAIWILHHELSVHHLTDILEHIRSLPLGRIIAALLLTAAGYGVMTTYDLLALRYLKQSLAYGKVAMAAFVGAAFSNNIGLSMIAGASVRYRLYASWGLSALEITKVVFFCTLTLWLGFFALGGLAFILDPMILPPAVHLPTGSTRAIGILMGLCVVGYLAAAKLRHQPVRLRSWQIDIPSFKIGRLQVLVGSADWLLAGSTLIVLLPATGPGVLPTLLVIYLLSQLAGLISQVPGGLGVFETAFLLMIGGRIPAEAVMGALFAYRVIYYLIPLAISAAVLGVNEAFSHRRSLYKLATSYRRWSAPVVPPVLALATFVAGAVLLFSGATPEIDHRLAWLRQVIPLPLLEASHFMGSMAGMALILLARGIQRRLDGAYWVSLVLLAAGIVASLLKGLDYEEALLLALLLGALLPNHRLFYRRASLLTQRFTPAWVAAIAIVMISALWLGLFSYKHVQYSGSLWWKFAFNAAAPRFLRATAGAATLLLTFAIARLMRPAVHRPAPATADEMAAVAQLVGESPRTTANLALLGDKAFLFNPSRSAFIMYAVEGRSWVSMGDPIGPEDQWPELIWRFREESDRFGGWAIFYQVTPDHLPHYLDLGLNLTKLGETARVHLADFSLEGSSRRGLRYTQRKLLKEGFSLKVLCAEEAARQLDRLKQVSDAWLAEKNTREKSFSLGSFNADYLRHFAVALVEKGGDIVAFANLWQGAAKLELSIDLMRFDPASAPHGVMEFLFIELLNWGRDQGYAWFDLGMAPLSGIEDRSLAPLWNRLAVFVARHGGHFYNFQGLRQYKDKFDPVWEPRYLASPGGLVLPAILSDLTQLVSGGLKGALLK
jgi:phosphatidylglycerol lysyltransferase